MVLESSTPTIRHLRSVCTYAPEIRPLYSLHQLIADVGVFSMLRMFVVMYMTTPTSQQKVDESCLEVV